MNRSILVIICDFLLISLLSFIRIEDLPASPQPDQRVTGGVDIAAVSNLVEVIQLELVKEREARRQAEQQRQREQQERLKLELALQEKEKLLAEKERQLEEQQRLLAQTEARARQLQELQRQLEQQIRERELQLQEKEQQLAKLQQQQETTLQRVAELQQALEVASREASLTREQVAMIERELAARREEARRLQEEIKRIVEERIQAESEKQKYAVELARLQTTAQLVTEQLEESRRRILQISQEKMQLQQHAETLARGVTQLAEQTAQLKQEVTESVQSIAKQTEQIRTRIEEQADWPVNAVYRFFETNAVNVGFTARITDPLSRRERTYAVRTAVVRFGNDYYAVLHLDRTPLGERRPPVRWSSVTGSIGVGMAHFPVSRVFLAAEDPRVVLVPVSNQMLTNWNVTVLKPLEDPAKFERAVVVSTGGDVRNSYYGEVAYKFHAATLRYVQVEKLEEGGLLASSRPVEGDLLLSKKGELLGIMVNDEWALLVHDLRPGRELVLGQAMGGLSTEPIASLISDFLSAQPSYLR